MVFWNFSTKKNRHFGKSTTSYTLAIIAVALTLIITTAGLVTISRTFPSTGNVIAINLQVYSDSQCTQTLTSIDWGTIRPGENASKTIYVKNTGNAPITLNMATSNWNPSNASQVVTLTWNKEGATLNAGQSTAATLTLTVSSASQGLTSFSMNIIISGSG